MADNSFVSIFGSGGGGGSAPASCCWIVQCGTGTTSTNRICATNVASGNYSTTFGKGNTSSGESATISGGANNISSAISSFIGGGNSNTASSCYTTILGGLCNTSSGFRSTNGGGFKNLNNAFDGFLGGGNCNNICNATSGCLAYGGVVVGGVGNNTIGGTWTLASCCFTIAPTITSPTCSLYNFIGGGFQNAFCTSSSVVASSIVGGSCNRMTTSVGTSFIGGGCANSLSNVFSSSIVGGISNSMSITQYSTIGGGQSNIIRSFRDFRDTCGGFIGGGVNNCISVTSDNTCSFYYGRDTIVGGFNNRITGTTSYYQSEGYNFIGGGINNYIGANSQGSTISGGQDNCFTSFLWGTISGGIANKVFANYSSIGGGQSNTISGCYARISGGANNTASGNSSFVGGGTSNISSNIVSIVSGGQLNTSSGYRSVIVGGRNNLNNSIDGFIGGGNCNNVCNVTSGCLSYGAVVVGGVGNNTTGGTWDLASCAFSVAPTICNAGQYSFIGGGFQNLATANRSTIGGGFKNRTASTTDTFIGGGNCNIICNPNGQQFSYGAVVVGGVGNNTTGGVFSLGNCCFTTTPTFRCAGAFSFVGGGLQNTASGTYSGVIGGTLNLASCSESFIVGSNITSDRVCATFVNNLSIKSIPTSAPAQSGAVWRCTADNTLRIVP